MQTRTTLLRLAEQQAGRNQGPWMTWWSRVAFLPGPPTGLLVSHHIRHPPASGSLHLPSLLCEYLSPWNFMVNMAHSLTSLRPPFKCYLLTEAFHEHLFKSTVTRLLLPQPRALLLFPCLVSFTGLMNVMYSTPYSFIVFLLSSRGQYVCVLSTVTTPAPRTEGTLVWAQ